MHPHKQEQLCDDTEYNGGFTYCDNWWFTWYNCTETTTQLSCLVNSYPTYITRTMECDGVKQCDDGSDEDCLVISDTCRVTQNRIKLENLTAVCETKLSTDLIRCPPNASSYFISDTEYCDGYVDCPFSNGGEEAVCNAVLGDSVNHRVEPVIRSENTLFMPRCTPGIAKVGDCEELSLEVEVGIKQTIFSETGKQYPCEYVGGEAYVLLNCLDKCQNKTSACHINDLNSCEPKGTVSEVLALETDNKTTSQHVVKIYLDKDSQNKSYVDRKFKCNNGECISSRYVCDYANDCGDNSDEVNCTNHFVCSNDNETLETIAINKTCDGSLDCSNKNDECGEQCYSTKAVSFRILEEPAYRVIALAIGLSAALVNILSLGLYFSKIMRHNSLSTFINDSFIALVALGDFAVGIYMTLIYIADYYYRNDYCNEKLHWLGSNSCSGLGILSTFGTQLSVLSMTGLSMFRIISLKTMMSFADFDKKNLIKFGIVVFIILISSAIGSVLPVLSATEDYFVNGLYYHGHPLFFDSTSKNTFYAALKFWYTESDLTADKPWSFWREATEYLSTSSHESLNIGFYGNHGVCLFKYFVTTDDPQWIFTMAILVLNLICFVIITGCYSMIILHTVSSSSSVGSGASTQARATMR